MIARNKGAWGRAGMRRPDEQTAALPPGRSDGEALGPGLVREYVVVPVAAASFSEALSGGATTRCDSRPGHGAPAAPRRPQQDASRPHSARSWC